jgi:hypothetical protein
MLMNLGLINGHRPEAVHGRMKEKEHLARYSSFEVKGMLFQSCNETLLIIILSRFSYSVLPALSLDGIIHVKIVENAFNMESFNEFITELINKMNTYDPIAHNKNSVIIMDNCRIHKDPSMIARAQAR